MVEWQRSGKKVTDLTQLLRLLLMFFTKALFRALVTILRLFLRLSPLSLSKGVEVIVIQTDFRWEEGGQGLIQYICMLKKCTIVWKNDKNE